MLQLTERQLEFAAREYCKQIGVDPDAKISGSPPPNPDGTVYAVCIWRPRWKLVAEEISKQITLLNCIEIAKRYEAV